MDEDPYHDVLGYSIVRTCSACPEQYDVFDSAAVKVGYLRLRHGEFTAEIVETDGGFGQVVYRGESDGDGRFEDAERLGFLQSAIAEIDSALNGHGDDTE